MKKPFRIEPDAAEELNDATQWYESRRSGLGRELLAAIDDPLAFIDQWPGSGSLIPKLPRDLPIRRVPVRRFPYHLVYLETKAAIRILAFAHDHRRARVLAVADLAVLIGCRLTPQFSGGALPHAARREDIMK